MGFQVKVKSNKFYQILDGIMLDGILYLDLYPSCAKRLKAEAYQKGYKDGLKDGKKLKWQSKN